MKQLLFPLLFLPCLALAQYPGNAGQKITLGEQTTADGLIFRGVASADTVAATSKITRANKQDTSAYLLLDTTTNLLWHYKIGNNAWLQAGGGTAVTSITGGTGLTGGIITSTGTLAADTNFLVTRFDTSSMLVNYWRAGRFAGTLPVAYGGTGSATQNFVDLTTTQSSIAGTKTFTSDIFVNSNRIGRGVGNDITNFILGSDAFLSNTTGNNNFVIGRNALYKNTTGSNNVCIGNVTGYENINGSANIWIGDQAGRYNTAYGHNTGIGYRALHNTDGSGNIGIGSETGYSITSGQNNVLLGYQAGYANAGSGRIITGSNNIAIGYQAVNNGGDSSNIIVLGNSSIARIKCQVTSITGLSDARDKDNIENLSYGIDFIEKLKPVSFTWNMRDGGKIGESEIGFVAQDLIKAQAEHGIIVPNLTSGTPERYEASPGVLIPIIVKALQDQQKIINDLQKRILKLENK